MDNSPSTDATTTKKADLFRKLSTDSVLLLPNAWDAASAAVIAAAGASAIATTSGGVSWSLGRGDGQHLTRDEMLQAVQRIVNTVDLPVTVDIEGGYGPTPEDVAQTIQAVAKAGAVGVNLEDSQAVGGPLFDLTDQTARLHAAREAAATAGLPELFVNARTDVFLFAIGPAPDRLNEVIKRTAAYAEAGADGIFVPGLLDLDALATLCAESPLPVNAMAVAGGPTVAELTQAGVRRISLGTALAQTAYTAARRAAEELLTTGTYETLTNSLDFTELNTLFHP
ncbi:isocitrate lyase/phosphoenolpyruvate mutase family protein [Nonomuraea sp. NPDC052265]|uniref:isocitrate lyase/phosphoenolpyruvate mutase family protein n=1 Tax=Nonomuraea sp. NPDC052265 TaxID=3364374 RepID=UPI0037C67579